jgi:hypothetical protein
MTLTTPQPPQPAWLLRITIAAAPANAVQWQEQLQLLRSLVTYDPSSQTWRTSLGTLDAHALDTLQRLYETAHRFGTRVHLEPTFVPASWQGPPFTDAELADVAASRRDAGRPLGQLPVA